MQEPCIGGEQLHVQRAKAVSMLATLNGKRP